jgi:hypothetical protein
MDCQVKIRDPTLWYHTALCSTTRSDANTYSKRQLPRPSVGAAAYIQV